LSVKDKSRSPSKRGLSPQNSGNSSLLIKNAPAGRPDGEHQKTVQCDFNDDIITPMREGENMSNLVDMIKDQQSKKRRGKYNKNEKLFEFIESTHMIQRYN
jgi:hypothetical protein